MRSQLVLLLATGLTFATAPRAVPQGLGGIGSGWAAGAKVEMFHALGLGFGESVSPSGTTLQSGFLTSNESVLISPILIVIASARILSAGEIEIQLKEATNTSLEVEVSNDFQVWSSLGPSLVRAGTITFFDPAGIFAGATQRFYRLRKNP